MTDDVLRRWETEWELFVAINFFAHASCGYFDVGGLYLVAVAGCGAWARPFVGNLQYDLLYSKLRSEIDGLPGGRVI